MQLVIQANILYLSFYSIYHNDILCMLEQNGKVSYINKYIYMAHLYILFISKYSKHMHSKRNYKN